LTIQPNYLAYLNLGTLHFQASRYGDAIAMFSRARDLKEDEYIVWGHLAHSYASGAEPEKAESAFRQAIELGTAEMARKPYDLWIVIDVAGYHAMLDEQDRGVELLEIAIARDPVDPALTAAIGETFEDLGQRERAIEWIGKALSAGMPPAWFEGRPSLSQLLADERYQLLVGESQGGG
jgi:tetratricopeptide (TPR) repeat protein